MAVVLVTGCRSGIGYETALAFGRRGDRVYATMRDPSRGGRLADAAKQESLSIIIDQLDVMVPASAQRAVEKVFAEAGCLDVLVNNAGIGFSGPVEEISEEDARAVYETNFWGPFRLIRAVLPGMRQAGAGVIVNVSSYSARQPVAPSLTMYSTTKHALSGMTDALRWELAGTGVRAVAIEPGFFATEFYRNVQERDPKSPYAPLMDKLDAAFKSLIGAGADPAIVANAIVGAVQDPNTPARVLVGEDAEAACEAFRQQGYAAWESVMGQRFGLS
jgi:NAD(P)-dependent dehydrogenase (short-subunit alcohol dehydrogenase family)